MAYKPILFNTEMVRAIQAGRKTQTRRVCKGQGDCNPVQVGYHPPCNPGDILWVRETWCDPEPDNYMVPVFYKSDMPLHWDAEDTAHGEAVDITADEFKWRPSIHMPKEFARTFLLVTDVQCERLQEITEEEAVKEGCSAGCINITCGPFGIDDDPDEWTAVEDFQRVWDSTINPADRDIYGWNANPWVWVIKFEKVERPDGWCV